MTNNSKQKHVLFLISVAIVLATVVAYEPVRRNGFVYYDDNEYVTENHTVRSGVTTNSIIWAFTKPHLANWHPLTWLSHMLDCEIYGLNPMGHHLTSVLIHIVNSLLLFWLLLKMTRAIWPSTFVAAVFALHPIHVESVGWISERKDMLSGLFWMLTIFAYSHYAERPNFKRYLLVLLAYVMGMMSKAMVVTLPFVLVLLDYWPLERVKWGRLNNSHLPIERAPPKVSTGRLIIEKIPIFVLSAILCMITFVSQKNQGTVVAFEKIPLGYRITNMFFSYIRYIDKTIWPSRLAIFYPHPRIDPSEVIVLIYALLLVLITVFSIYKSRQRKYVIVGWLWFVGTLVPVIGLVQVGSQGMADRYMYIPMIGLLIAAAWTVNDLIGKRLHLKIITSVLTAAALLTITIVTRTQVGYWRDSLTLFGHTLKVTENNSMAEYNYGWALLRENRFSEAELHFRNGIRISPTFAQLYGGLGTVYAQMHKYQEAVQNFKQDLKLKPDDALILNNLAWVLATTEYASAHDANKAIEYSERACELTEYKNPEFLDTLAATYAAAGRFDDAVTTAWKAIDTSKDYGQEALCGEIQKRLELYKAGQPYHQK